MDKNEKMLTMAEALWITGIIVEIGVLSYQLFLYSANLWVLSKLPPINPLLASLEVMSGILVLISVEIIADIFQKRKPFYLLLAAVLTKFVWMSLQLLIYNCSNTIPNSSQQGVISMFRDALLFEMFHGWIIKVAIAILVLIAFLEIAELFTDNRFKLSGILILVSTLLNAIYGMIKHSLTTHNYASSNPHIISVHTLNRISSTVNLTCVLLIIIALIVLIVAVIHMEAPKQYEQTESSINS